MGVLAIAGLPPLNGFVSEWLLLQTFLFSHEVPHPFVNMLLPLGAAIVALAAALAGYVMVKFFGIVFLGSHANLRLPVAHDVDRFEKAGLVWLAIGCVLLGLLPNQVIHALGAPPGNCVGAAPNLAGQSWWMLAPLTERTCRTHPWSCWRSSWRWSRQPS